MDHTEKYSEGYFNHWLAMFSIHHKEWTEENIVEQISLYKQMEGEEGFEGLQAEVKENIHNNDLIHFLELAKEYSEEVDVKIGDLEKMAKLIVES